MKLAGQGNGPIRRQNGYAMAALLVGLGVMSVLMSMALPVWSHMIKREKEEELIWRGNQYTRAIGLFQRKFANAYPPSVDVLVEQRFLRKKYKDPITNDDFVLLPAGAATMPGQPPGVPGRPGAPGGAPPQPRIGGGPAPGVPPQTQIPGSTLNLGIGGVASKSTDTSIRIYNGRQKYNEWTFVYMQTSQRIGVPGGGQFPGAPIQPGMRPGVQPGMTPGAPGAGGGRPPVPFGPPGGPFGQPPSQPSGPRPLQRPPGS